MSGIIRLIALASVILFSTHANAQYPNKQYPNKPVRLLVPFPAGAGVDAVARLLAQQLTTSLGQPIIVDNRAGADGAIATEVAINAVPDGYTVLLGISGPITDIAMLRKNPPYDAMNGLTPLGLVGRFPYFVIVHPDVPANNIAQLVAHARANPGKLSNGTGNANALLLTTIFSKAAGMNLVNVPYKGDAVAIVDLVAGRINMMLIGTTNPALGLAREGKLRALATLLQTRSVLAPDVPTMAESGYPTVTTTGWLAMFAPAKLPSDITTRLSRTISEALRRPDMREALGQHAFEISTSTSEELAVLMKQHAARMKSVYAEVGFEPQ